jgi:hypothetical protein
MLLMPCVQGKLYFFRLVISEVRLTTLTATSPQTWLALRRRNRDEVRFSNRPFGVKRVQTTHHYSVVRGLVLFSGIGAKALVWGFLSQAG